MNARYRSSVLFLFCVSASVLPACGQAPSVSDEPERAAVDGTAARTPSAAQAMSPAPAGDSPGKPQAPIDLKYELLGEPRIGQPLQIRLTSRSALDFRPVNLALSGSERLLLAPDSRLVELTSALRDQPAERTITVTPMAPGTLYLNVAVSAQVDGEVESRSLTIPVRVGGGAAAPEPEGTLSTDESGTPIITLPARE